MRTVYEISRVEGPHGPRFQVRVTSNGQTTDLGPARIRGSAGFSTLRGVKQAIVADANRRSDPRATVVDEQGEMGIVQYGHLHWFPGALAAYTDAAGQLLPNARGGGKVIESKRWRHRSGRTASLYGAVPWTGSAGDRESDWRVESAGWTIQWDDGTIGTGQVPAATREEAEERLARIMARRTGGVALKPNWRMMLDLGGVERRLGADHVAAILASDTPRAIADGRASMAWQDNDVPAFEAYTSLARLIDDGDLDDLIAEARRSR